MTDHLPATTRAYADAYAAIEMLIEEARNELEGVDEQYINDYRDALDTILHTIA